jgi:ABC-type lipoprotein release transport system permease subunit
MQQALGVATGSWWYVLAGIVASWILTLGFSVLPAMQNSRISPAEAMRVV